MIFDLLPRIVLRDVGERLVCRSDGWYVKTREVSEKGPYPSRMEALEGLYRHVTLCVGGLNSCDDALAAAFLRHSIRNCNEPGCALCADLLAILPQAESA